MSWYWNMSNSRAAYFFVGQFLAVYVIGYVVGGIAWSSWTTVPGLVVPLWPGIGVNLAWSFYNVAHL